MFSFNDVEILQNIVSKLRATERCKLPGQRPIHPITSAVQKG